MKKMFDIEMLCTFGMLIIVGVIGIVSGKKIVIIYFIISCIIFVSMCVFSNYLYKKHVKILAGQIEWMEEYIRQLHRYCDVKMRNIIDKYYNVNDKIKLN